MTAPVLLVVGQGRCGMSAMMQALHAGGIPCVGEWPAFEPAAVMWPIRRFWLSQQRGKAVKVLSPHMSPALGEVPRVVIQMRRDRMEQARSAKKMMKALEGRLLPVSVEAYANRMREDDIDAHRVLLGDRRPPRERTPPLAMGELSFETLVTDPATAMRVTADFLAPWWRLDAVAAARAIKVRDPACARDVSIELSLAERAEGRG